MKKGLVLPPRSDCKADPSKSLVDQLHWNRISCPYIVQRDDVNWVGPTAFESCLGVHLGQCHSGRLLLATGLNLIRKRTWKKPVKLNRELPKYKKVRPKDPALHFRISSVLKRVSGRDLVTNEFVAIFELVKNSFDARAKR